MTRTGAALIVCIALSSNSSAHQPVSPIEMKTFAGAWDAIGPDYEWAVRLEMEPGASTAFLVIAPRVPVNDDEVYVIDKIKVTWGKVHFSGKDAAGKTVVEGDGEGTAHALDLKLHFTPQAHSMPESFGSDWSLRFVKVRDPQQGSAVAGIHVAFVRATHAIEKVKADRNKKRIAAPARH